MVFALFGHFPGVRAENPLVIAVSANFSLPMRELAHRFEGRTGRRLAVVSGSTGKHYAQITNGAPFDLFFSADEDRPRRLEQDGLAIAGSRVSYAAGRLVLWSANEDLVDPAGKILSSDAARHLAVANPRLAPYGRAAMEALEGLGVQDLWSSRLLRGENVAQVYQFVAAGNADLGLVALSQVVQKGGGSSWLVPEDLYEPILQQAVALSRAPGAKEFLEYVASPEARELIRSYGYRVPAPSRPQRGVDGER